MYRLVIVDDEGSIAEGIASLFPWRDMGYEVIGVFTRGREALDFIRNHSVDVLLSDIEMPDVNGISLCADIRDLNVKVVFISSYQNYEYFRSAIKYQVEDYLLKPVKFDELRECMTKLRTKLDEEYCVSEEHAEQNETYYEKVIHEVKEYIEAHYKEGSLEEAAGKVNLSAGYLSKIFKEKSGVGFQDYLLSVRMKKACELLDDIHFKSYDVAYFVGYDNPKNFSRAFKKYYGRTPKEYRNSKCMDAE